jgi:hypothetical protein
MARTGKSFWKQFPKGALPHIRTLELGQVKYAYADRLDTEAEFLQFLALGVLWAFPNLRELHLHLAFQQVDPAVLLDIIKRLKEGTPGVQRCLKRICIYQATDLFLVRDVAWRYVSLTHAGGHPVEIFVSGEKALDYKKKNFKYFGPGLD